MQKPQRAIVSHSGQLEPREKIDSLHVGAAQSAQITNQGSGDRGGHLKIDRLPKQKSSVRHR
jgi:hypothetical protein